MPLLVGEAVEDVQAGGDRSGPGFVANAGDELADEPGAVLERAAVLARPGSGGEQLVEQVAVALLEVDEVEPDPMRQRGGRGVAVLKAVELVVGDQRESGPARARGFVDDGPGVEQRVVLGQDRPLRTSSGRSGSIAGR